ncbi:hypothetical protein D3C76_1652100 [compost metagenome]
MLDLGNHRLPITMAFEGPRIGPGDPNQLHRQPAQFLDQFAVGVIVERPAIAEHPFNPALEQRG